MALAGAASITIVNRDLARGSGLVALLSEKTQARADLVGWDRTYRIPTRGCIVLDGLGMLVNQGAVSIRHWTGIDPETEVMRRKLEKIFGV
jgi:shikimate dehydrogenase